MFMEVYVYKNLYIENINGEATSYNQINMQSVYAL